MTETDGSFLSPRKQRIRDLFKQKESIERSVEFSSNLCSSGQGTDIDPLIVEYKQVLQELQRLL